MLRCALHIFSGKNFLNFAFVALCGALQTHFHGRGRNGKRHLQRRFLRKHGAAGERVLALSVTAYAVPPLPKGEARALPGTFSLHLKLQQRTLDLGSPFGRAGAGAPERANKANGCCPSSGAARHLPPAGEGFSGGGNVSGFARGSLPEGAGAAQAATEGVFPPEKLCKK